MKGVRHPIHKAEDLRLRQPTDPTPDREPSAEPAESPLQRWLADQLAKAESSLRAREQGARVWSSGTDKEWAESSKLHPDTANLPPIKQAQRIVHAEREKRMAEKCRVDVENFRALAALEKRCAEMAGLIGEMADEINKLIGNPNGTHFAARRLLARAAALNPKP
jgi:phytoene/squalene synthetase